MKTHRYNKYATPTKKERIVLLKKTIEKLSKLKGYENVVKKYKKQLRELKHLKEIK